VKQAKGALNADRVPCALSNMNYMTKNCGLQKLFPRKLLQKIDFSTSPQAQELRARQRWALAKRKY
jgi:hypothetical protein